MIIVLVKINVFLVVFSKVKPKRKWISQGESEVITPNILKRDFNASKPNAVCNKLYRYSKSQAMSLAFILGTLSLVYFFTICTLESNGRSLFQITLTGSSKNWESRSLVINSFVSPEAKTCPSFSSKVLLKTGKISST